MRTVEASAGSENAVMDEAPYTRAEVLAANIGLPQRGLFCTHCDTHIPQFRDLSQVDEWRVRHLIFNGRPVMAVAELRAATGCPLSWASLWVLHRGKPFINGPVPCPHCGKPLRTPFARQCRFCHADWHAEQNLEGSVHAI